MSNQSDRELISIYYKIIGNNQVVSSNLIYTTLVRTKKEPATSAYARLLVLVSFFSVPIPMFCHAYAHCAAKDSTLQMGEYESYKKYIFYKAPTHKRNTRFILTGYEALKRCLTEPYISFPLEIYPCMIKAKKTILDSKDTRIVSNYDDFKDFFKQFFDQLPNKLFSKGRTFSSNSRYIMSPLILFQKCNILIPCPMFAADISTDIQTGLSKPDFIYKAFLDTLLSELAANLKTNKALRMYLISLRENWDIWYHILNDSILLNFLLLPKDVQDQLLLSSKGILQISPALNILDSAVKYAYLLNYEDSPNPRVSDSALEFFLSNTLCENKAFSYLIDYMAVFSLLRKEDFVHLFYFACYADSVPQTD